MISFDPLWSTMREKGVTQYALIHKFHVSPGQIHRIKHNESISTHTVEMFCRILGCGVSDVMIYLPDPEPDPEPDPDRCPSATITLSLSAQIDTAHASLEQQSDIRLYSSDTQLS